MTRKNSVRIADKKTEFEPRTSKKGSNGVVHSIMIFRVFRLRVKKNCLSLMKTSRG